MNMIEIVCSRIFVHKLCHEQLEELFFSKCAKNIQLCEHSLLLVMLPLHHKSVMCLTLTRH